MEWEFDDRRLGEFERLTGEPVTRAELHDILVSSVHYVKERSDGRELWRGREPDRLCYVARKPLTGEQRSERRILVNVAGVHAGHVDAATHPRNGRQHG